MNEELKEEHMLYIKKNSFTDIFQGFCLEFKYTVFHNPSNIALSVLQFFRFYLFNFTQFHPTKSKLFF